MSRHEQHVETGFYPLVTYLLIDDLYVARQEGVRRVLNRPERVPEPVLQRDRPWEVGTHMWFLPGSSFYDLDEKLFKLYYLAHDPGFREAYPELKWDMPPLFLVKASWRLEPGPYARELLRSYPVANSRVTPSSPVGFRLMGMGK